MQCGSVSVDMEEIVVQVYASTGICVSTETVKMTSSTETLLLVHFCLVLLAAMNTDTFTVFEMKFNTVKIMNKRRKKKFAFRGALLAVWPWASSLTSLGPDFLTWKLIKLIICHDDG